MALSCTKIEVEKIRATISINDYEIKTPYVKSFNVTKSRSSNIGTFSATVEVPVNANLGTSGGDVRIFAGKEGKEKQIFTGFIKQIVPNPCPGKPNYMLLTISGKDIMSRLENMKFSRRIKSDGPGVFVVIEGSKGTRPTAFWSTDKRVRGGGGKFTAPSPSLDGRREHNSLTNAQDFSKSNSSGFMGQTSELVPEPGKGGTGGLNIHSHTSQNQGGPAFGVYGPS